MSFQRILFASYLEALDDKFDEEEGELEEDDDKEEAGQENQGEQVIMMTSTES